MLGAAEARSIGCGAQPPPGGFGAGSVVEIPALDGVPADGVVELTGGVVDIPSVFGATEAQLREFGVMGIARNQGAIRIPVDGGPIEGVGIFVIRWDDEPFDRALAEALADEFGDGEPREPRPCFYLAPISYTIEGDYDAATGAIDARALVATEPNVVISGCEFNEWDPPGPPIPADVTGSFDGSTAALEATGDDDGQAITLPLLFSVDGLSAADLGITEPTGEFVTEGAVLSDDLTGSLDLDGDDADSTPSDGAATGSTTGSSADGEDSDVWDDLFGEGVFDDDIAISEEDAALASLLGLLGVSALAIASLLEGGFTMADLRAGLGDEELPQQGPVVIDELGNELMPDADGMYEWETPDCVERVSLDELRERIAAARAADLARDARHEGIVAEQYDDEAAVERFEQLDDQGRRQDAAAREELADELDLMRSQERTRQRVADMLQEQASTGGWDAIAARLDDGHYLTTEELQELREILKQLTERQGAIDPASTGSFVGDLADEFGADAAAAQEAVATFLDENVGWPAGWMARNPATVGRLAVGIATAGFSEGLIAPHEMMAAMEQAAEAAHAQGRDLTYSEAMLAAAWQAGPGMLMGKGFELFGRAAGPAILRWGDDAFHAARKSIDDHFAGVTVRQGSDVFEDAMGRQAAKPVIPSVRDSARLADADGLHWNPQAAAKGVQQLEGAP